MAKQEANWVELSVDTLDTQAQEAYKAYKDAYAAMKAKRTAFEDYLQATAGLPEGKRMIFGYNFGKLSVAIVDDDRKPAKAKPAKLSLSDYLAREAAR